MIATQNATLYVSLRLLITQTVVKCVTALSTRLPMTTTKMNQTKTQTTGKNEYPGFPTSLPTISTQKQFNPTSNNKQYWMKKKKRK